MLKTCPACKRAKGRNQVTRGPTGVRYSLENPRAYVEAIWWGFQRAGMHGCGVGISDGLHLLGLRRTPKCPLSRRNGPHPHILRGEAGNRRRAPYAHLGSCDHVPFFTVYGPGADRTWPMSSEGRAAGRRDRGLQPRQDGADFTYVTDLVRGIRLLIDTPPGGACSPRTSCPVTA
jgi:UDP-glucuronate 4-epimerase